MNNALKRVLDLSVKHGFLKSNSNLKSCEFGPLALLLANNIRNQWVQSNIINTDLNVFLYESQQQQSWQSGMFVSCNIVNKYIYIYIVILLQ